MPYSPDSVVHAFESGVYRVELRSTGKDIKVRILESKTGREVTPEQLDVGLQLRIQDEQAKAAELVRNQDRLDDARRARQHRTAWDAYRIRKAALQRQTDRSFVRFRAHD